MKYIEPLSRLIAAFSKLPSVGEKTAARYAYAVLNSTDEDVKELAEAIATLKENVHFCSVCGNFTEHDVCDICATRS
ncbi:MAG: recombination protein RecR, partial [Clostridia bacterium]|nr:recombination protein RecR [Clostridia bacterium]